MLREWDVGIGRAQSFGSLPVQTTLTYACQNGSEDLLTVLLSSIISSSAQVCRKVAAGETVEIETVKIYGWSWTGV